MRKQSTVRDNLYATLDKLIGHSVAIEKDLPAITLNSAQYQTFADFNKPVSGKYFYRGVHVKGPR